MKKLENLRGTIKKLDIDGLIVTNPFNRQYLTGFTGTAGMVLISQTEAKFLTDFRYNDQAKEEVKDYEVIICKGSETLLKSVFDQINRMDLCTVGFESTDVSFDLYSQFEKNLEIRMKPTKSIIEEMRMIKTDEEIQKIKTAAEITDKTFKHILTFIKPGITELDLSHEIEYFMRKQGATTNASARIIVASGYRSAYPHGGASSKVIENGDIITFDFGAQYQGYASDMTRTVAVGEPNSKLKEIYQIVYDALELSLNTLQPGMSCREGDAIARDYITAKGYGEYFGHGGGHGIGLEIHEDPYFSKSSKQVLAPGMVVTVEPGIYIPGLGGVRIEDDVLIKSDGIEILTHSPKDLIII
ncbi:Xaa-Pro dipeptidase [Heyndrickxia shackletonii]|uniref:Xaa-Pro dipeptidase n=1 Tax=Heyndrickxia shackletonii TaxID=157838 RepID=A0A0Q3WVD7_9BACI|nr:Xaa-Pro peptidase family protein [Heyndrickxia shackletonii]KQL52874.1 Xaa-Pro dipeptidase [Heyndrickxia shackletonii]NEZ00356.1 aminopeptidase P family protein [Heyndrickxia shackletonii]